MRGSAGWLQGARPYALLPLLCLLLYLPGIARIPPLDRDEARFAQATRQMLETGDFLRIDTSDPTAIDAAMTTLIGVCRDSLAGNAGGLS